MTGRTENKYVLLDEERLLPICFYISSFYPFILLHCDFSCTLQDSGFRVGTERIGKRYRHGTERPLRVRAIASSQRIRSRETAHGLPKDCTAKLYKIPTGNLESRLCLSPLKVANNRRTRLPKRRFFRPLDNA